jgi:hypothetical protein
MLKIFAKYGTDKKVLMMCPTKQVGDVLTILNKKYGGNWVWVDKLHGYNEILCFNDGLKYLGFHGMDERYCKGIEPIPE